MFGTIVFGGLVAAWATFALNYAIDNYKKGYGASPHPRLHH